MVEVIHAEGRRDSFGGDVGFAEGRLELIRCIIRKNYASIRWVLSPKSELPEDFKELDFGNISRYFNFR